MESPSLDKVKRYRESTRFQSETLDTTPFYPGKGMQERDITEEDLVEHWIPVVTRRLNVKTCSICMDDYVKNRLHLAHEKS